MKRLAIVAGALLVAALLAWGVVALGRNLEWHDEVHALPARGLAATDANYAIGRLVAATGGTFVHRPDLDTLPPPGATLVLSTDQWALFPDRVPRLKAWVEAGGHLAVEAYFLGGDANLGWVPLRLYDPVKADARRRARAAAAASAALARPTSAPTPEPAPATSATHSHDDDDDEDDDDDAVPAKAPPPASSATASAARRAANAAPPPECERFEEPSGVPPAQPWHRGYRACLHHRWPTLWPVRTQPTWALADAGGDTMALRVAVGRGTVTAHHLTHTWANGQLAREGHAAAAAAVLQLGPGRQVWLVDDENKDPLPQWLWQQARTAIVLGALAVAAWLWRRGVRFGPRVADDAGARRSIAEQVRGTASFLHRHDPAALHAAQVRALQELARRHIAAFDTLLPVDGWRAIARAAQLDGAALLRAALPANASATGTVSRTQWLSALSTLEHARRALQDTVRAAAQDPALAAARFFPVDAPDTASPPPPPSQDPTWPSTPSNSN